MALVARLLKSIGKGSVINVARCLSTRTTSVTASTPIFHFTNNPWIWQQPEPIKLPLNNVQPFILPNDFLNVPSIDDPTIDNVIDEPININNDKKEAVRMIVIRRKKMKKHKLKKLRKRMKFEWAKKRQRRELKKEKEFQAILIAQCKEAESFSAEDYVRNKLKEYKEEPPLPFHETEEYKELMRRKRLRLNIEK